MTFISALIGSDAVLAFETESSKLSDSKRDGGCRLAPINAYYQCNNTCLDHYNGSTHWDRCSGLDSSHKDD